VPEYRLVWAVMQHLPASGKWTPKYRYRWLRAMVRAVDLLVEMERPPSTPSGPSLPPIETSGEVTSQRIA
jgi:hypothetical protein